MANGVGRPTELTEEAFRKIKSSILDGNDLKTTSNVCEIEVSTLYDWTSRNYHNISDKIEGWKRDRRLLLANITSDTIQTLPVIDGNGKLDKELLKIKQKEAEFIRETLGKDYYSKRSELTGKDGEALIPSSEQREKSNKAINDILNDNTRNIEQQ